MTNCAQVNEVYWFLYFGLKTSSPLFSVFSCGTVYFVQILTDAALLKRQKKEIEELRCKLKVCSLS